MSVACSHSILCTNYKNASTTATPIILLRGNVSNQLPTCSMVLSVTNSTTGLVSEPFAVSRKSGEFKGLLNVRAGVNQLEMNYCTSIQTITITYEPICSPYGVRIFYIICRDHDGCFQSLSADCTPDDACRKLTLACEIVQTIYAEKLPERRSFRIANVCEPFHSDLPLDVARTMTEHQLWTHFAKEIVSTAHKNAGEKYVAFLGCTRFVPFREDERFSGVGLKDRTVANAALGGGDLVLFGTGCLYTWPSHLNEVIAHFKDDRAVNIRRFMDDSNGRRTRGGCWETNLGSLCHEIGHIFGLGHTRRGIMGGGVDYVSRMFTVDNLTVHLADRMVDKTNENDKQRDARLTRMKRNSRIIDRYQEQRHNDLTYFAESSAIILSTHKWLRRTPAQDPAGRISFSPSSRTVSSEHALRIIELRKRPNALMVQFFSFEPSAGVTTFCIPDDADLDGIDVFAMDVDGNYETFDLDAE